MAKRLTGGYYGTRNADFFPRLFVERAAAGKMFIDITAGTGQFPYRMVTEHKTPVTLFERCPYVGYLLRAVFEGEVNHSDILRAGLPPGELEGFLSKQMSDLVGGIFSVPVARRIDYLCVHAQSFKDSSLLHAVGRALNGFTFRSMNWCKNQPGGEPNNLVTVEEIDAKVMRVLKEVKEFSHGIPGDLQKLSNVFIGDSVKLVPKLGKATDVFKDAVVYADPAWPWAGSATSKASNDNPYAFAYKSLSSILDEIWTRRDEERIRTETLGWVRGSFEAGARTFISCTQDTNFPHPDVVRQWFIDAGFKVPHTMKLHDRSASAAREYLNYWFFITP